MVELAIAIESPNYADAYNNRGNALQQLKRPEDALASFDMAIALNPDVVDAYYNNRGMALAALKRHEKALASYDKAIALKSDSAEAHYNRGNTLRDLNRPDEALASYDAAIALKPDYADAYNNRGNALHDLQHSEEALASYDRAIALKSDFAEAHNNRGNPLLDLNRPEEALASHDTAIALKADYAEAHYNRGIALVELKRCEEALASYDAAIGSGGFRPHQTESWAINNRRNIQLSRLAVLKDSNIEFYSLQKGEPAESELAGLMSDNWNGPDIIDFTSRLQNFSDTAALVENLDLVISVDTSTAHLAGALGKPVWILNRFDTCWRWFLERTDSPWYPTVKVYRQETAGHWDDVIQRIKMDLTSISS